MPDIADQVLLIKPPLLLAKYGNIAHLPSVAPKTLTSNRSGIFFLAGLASNEPY
jgi:hypothetical protein